MVSVDWPEFAYPYFRPTAWASLLGNVTLVLPAQHTGENQLQVLSPNAYLPAKADGAPDFGQQMISNRTSPLYLDTTRRNTFLNLNGSANGLESLAHMAGLKPVDVFGTTTAIWLIMAGAIVMLSLTVWGVDRLHAALYRTHQRNEGYTSDDDDNDGDDEDDGPGTAEEVAVAHRGCTTGRWGSVLIRRVFG